MDSDVRGPASLAVLRRAFADWWDAWLSLVILNLLWWLAWVTVVLGPPATFGLAFAANRLARFGQAPDLGTFLGGLRRHWLRSWGWMLLNLAVAALTLVNLSYYSQVNSPLAPLLLGTTLFLASMWLIAQFYTLGYLMEQDPPRLLHAIRNGIYTVLAAPGFTVTLALALVAILAISVGMVAPILFGAVPLILILANHAAIDRLDAYGIRRREPAVPDELPPIPHR